MRIAVSADGQDLGSKVSPVFGRCPCFVMVTAEDDKIKSFEVIENTAVDKSSGAGTEAAQLVGDNGADAVISGGIGPKALLTLKQWEIQIFEAKPGTVEYNINMLLEENLGAIENPPRPSGAEARRETELFGR